MDMLRKYCGILAMLLSGFIVTEVSAAEPLSFGIHPYKSSQKLIKIYQPLVSLLSNKLDRQVKIVIAKDYATHIKSIGNDELDIAYLGPASYVRMVDQFGKKRILARQAIKGSPTFQGKIIISENSEITSIEQLKGKRFAFGDPNSTMSHLVQRSMLIDKGVTASTLEKIDFVGSHDNVALGVLTGDYHAGAVKEAVYGKYKSRGIKALATTEKLSEHLFVASNKLSGKLVSEIRGILLGLESTEEGKSAMTSIKSGMTAMVSTTDADYDNLRSILKKLKDSGVIK